MGKQEKLRNRLLSKPKDFTWSEMNSLLSNLGFELLKGSGSRRKFVHNETKTIIIIHEPHPDNILKRYIIEQVTTKLVEMELINNE
ncbi:MULTISPECIES: type II toxin-antitoxin system HicA family toxin [unclassified Pseudoalteromonas]|uniref:type II toxin-antitoxin system HicA family toxin n=1 Tax=unclassified Pseudoalteromonas TaxID=194690 RepID=UPI00257FBDBB|nr:MULTISPECIES: type II toxin-antitoxin system HicA family toxin [unclassified Pseudoalteromonas]|tara:strand:- start:2474 stop:2731 length:258 start_codon:yes stop_codon:yes gene_type:complete